MYETHHPGFCYHSTGAIKESGTGSLTQTLEDSDDSYEVVRDMLFTNGEVDVEKVLCLHLLAAHTHSNLGIEVPVLESFNSSWNFDKGRKKHLTGVWNILLPCYVIDIEHDTKHNLYDSNDESSAHREVSLENETPENFEQSYHRYTQNNADITSVLTVTDRSARMAPRTLGKIPIISPHVYSLLDASHELRVKQAIAEGYTAKRYNNKRSSIDMEMLDVKSITDTFRLLDDDHYEDERSARMTLDTSARDWTTKAGLAKLSGIKIHSRISPFDSSYKLDRSITMLKRKIKRTDEEFIKNWRTNELNVRDEEINDLVTIKPSHRNLAVSKTSSPFRAMKNGQCLSANSFDSTAGSPGYLIKKFRNSVYLNSPVKSFALSQREYKTVEIFVNHQIEALVHLVLEVLGQVNPGKVQRLLEIARDPKKIRDMFGRPDIQNFVGSLLGQPIVSSPESFVVSAATALGEIDTRLEGLLDNELVAVTLELPSAPSLAMLIAEIKDNIFLDSKKNSVLVGDQDGENSIPRVSKPQNSPSLNISVAKDSTNVCLNNKKEALPINNSKPSFDHKLPMKCKTETIAIANQDEGNSKEQVLVEFDSLEKTFTTTTSRKILDNDSTSRKDRNDKLKLRKSKLLINEKSRFKPEKAVQDINNWDSDRIILRRLTRSQRISGGRMYAAVKNKRINDEVLIREKTSLEASITPVLSRESIKILTRGTTYSKYLSMKKHDKEENKEEQTVARTYRLTGLVLTKVRRDIAEHETKRRLDYFFAK